MDKISQVLPKTDRTYTAEELEQARQAQTRRMAEQLGMCRYDCPNCHGIGWVRNDDGHLVLCPSIDRWKLRSAARFGITKDEYDELYWMYPIPEQGINLALRAVRKTIEQGFGWVYLWGGYGTGKSLVLKIAVAEALHQGRDAAYVRIAEILDHLRRGFDEKSGESETARLNWWAELPVLCIDEFDRMRGTPYTDERRFVLMDRRYEQACRREAVTIIASNEDPARLPGYLYDRVMDGRFTIVQVGGDSMRPGMRWEA